MRVNWRRAGQSCQGRRPFATRHAKLLDVCWNVDGEATNGARPPRKQGSVASKQGTCSNTMDTALAAMAVVLCRLNAGESGKCCGQPNSGAADVD